jgi:hypothetical protein
VRDKINRRAFLGMAAAGTAGLVLGDVLGLAKGGSSATKETIHDPEANITATPMIEAFYGAINPVFLRQHKNLSVWRLMI